MKFRKARISGGNIKLGNMGSFSKLYGSDSHYIEKLGFAVSGTCGKYCTGCSKDCYVRKSYRYKSVMYGHALNTLAVRNDLAQVFADLNNQLTRKRKKFETVRINQSGEIETSDEFIMWCELAKCHPETTFYVYTKAYDLVLATIKAGLPSNLVVLISVWHEYGANEYLSVAHLDNVKAFVYDDGFDYAALGIIIQTYCKAYDENGKLDHAITCNKCQKCFNKLASCKVIGTYPH